MPKKNNGLNVMRAKGKKNDSLMFERLRSYFEKLFPITDEQFSFIKTRFVLKTLTKGEFFIKEGEVAQAGAYVAHGCLRTYVVDKQGKEHIIQFSPEAWWVADWASATTGSPSRFFVDAVEESTILTSNINSFREILNFIPAMDTAFRSGLEKNSANKDSRIALSLSASAEERYDHFIKTYPSLLRRIPLHMIASYLGIVPETLSRIRKNKSKNERRNTSIS